jgi:hypothetical protein
LAKRRETTQSRRTQQEQPVGSGTPSVSVEPGPTPSLLAEVPIIRLNGIRKDYIDRKLSVNYHSRHSPLVVLN